MGHQAGAAGGGGAAGGSQLLPLALQSLSHAEAVVIGDVAGVLASLIGGYPFDGGAVEPAFGRAGRCRVSRVPTSWSLVAAVSGHNIDNYLAGSSFMSSNVLVCGVGCTVSSGWSTSWLQAGDGCRGEAFGGGAVTELALDIGAPAFGGVVGEGCAGVPLKGGPGAGD